MEDTYKLDLSPQSARLVSNDAIARYPAPEHLIIHHLPAPLLFHPFRIYT